MDDPLRQQGASGSRTRSIEVPTVANGDVSKDGLTLKYKLRHNIKWQDGVAAHLPRSGVHLASGDEYRTTTSSRPTATKTSAASTAPNPYVAVIHMKRLYAPFLQQLWSVNGNSPILPEHLLAKYNDDKGSFNTAPFNSLPVGSGPFKVVSWQRGQEVRMEANPDFYLGKPKLKTVIYKIIADENTVDAELQSHELDMLAHGTGLKWPEYAALGRRPEERAERRSASTRTSGRTSTSILRHPIVGDVNVRRALAYATDRQEIIEKISARFGDTAAETDQSPDALVGVHQRHHALSVRSGKGASAARRRRLEGRARTAFA